MHDEKGEEKKKWVNRKDGRKKCKERKMERKYKKER